MKNLYESSTAAEIKQRIANLKADSRALWGKMSPSQAAAHLANTMEMAVGESNPARMFLGRLLGRMVIKRITADDKPMRQNSPTAPNLLISDPRDMEKERARLMRLVEMFCAGPGACTRHPHTFFGPMTPDEWAILMYKHCDHHLRQFGV